MQSKRYTYNTIVGEELEKELRVKFQYPHPLQSRTIPNAIIVPRHYQYVGGVYDKQGVLVDESVDYNYSHQIVSPTFKWNCEEEVDESVFYMGCVDDNWGFLFVECINRLWPILNNSQKYKIAYCGGDENQGTFGLHTKRFLELCGWLGLEANQFIHIHQVTRFKQVIVPEKSFFHIEIPTYGKQTPLKYVEYINQTLFGKPCYYWTKEYAAICRTISNNCVLDLPTYDKVYFSRTRLKQNKEIGEKPIENIFASNGYQVLYPEQLSISKQIWYIKNCKEFASIEGTLAHNVIFASDKLEKQIILRKQSEIIPRQVLLNQVVNVPIIYIDVYKEPFAHFPLSHSKGPFWIKMNTNLLAFCKNEGWHIPRSYDIGLLDGLLYVHKCLKSGIEKLVKRILNQHKCIMYA